MKPCRYKTCDMGHIYHKIRPRFVCDLTDLLKSMNLAYALAPAMISFGFSFSAIFSTSS